jgi:uncharacterized membrane protein YheB (UPF0754 family)
MNEYLFWIVPPLAGGAIGFLTNVVAIRMLFRPLREIRIFGFRLPFTPGILPKQRGKLADSIGSMVERELLTPEILRERLRREDTRLKIQQAVGDFSEKIGNEPLEKFFIPHKEAYGALLLSAGKKLYPGLREQLINFLNRDEVRREFEYQGRIFISNAVLKLNVFQRFFISAAQYDKTLDEKMPEIIDDLVNQISEICGDPKTMNAVIGAVKNVLVQKITGEKLSTILALNGEKKKKLDSYICAGLLELMDGQIENFLKMINVRTMVCDRINALEMEKVERIVLDVMANQFKWIDIFGAILGFLIGLFQALFSWFLRSA